MFFMNSDTPINDIGFGKKISGKLPLFSFSQSPGIAGSYSWLANGPANLSMNAASKKETKRGCDLRCLVEQCCWGRSIRSYTEGTKSTHRDSRHRHDAWIQPRPVAKPNQRQATTRSIGKNSWNAALLSSTRTVHETWYATVNEAWLQDLGQIFGRLPSPSTLWKVERFFLLFLIYEVSCACSLIQIVKGDHLADWLFSHHLLERQYPLYSSRRYGIRISRLSSCHGHKGECLLNDRRMWQSKAKESQTGVTGDSSCWSKKNLSTCSFFMFFEGIFQQFPESLKSIKLWPLSSSESF